VPMRIRRHRARSTGSTASVPRSVTASHPNVDLDTFSEVDDESPWIDKVPDRPSNHSPRRKRSTSHHAATQPARSTSTLARKTAPLQHWPVGNGMSVVMMPLDMLTSMSVQQFDV
jgi:hypothetical protein